MYSNFSRIPNHFPKSTVLPPDEKLIVMKKALFMCSLIGLTFLSCKKNADNPLGNLDPSDPLIGAWGIIEILEIGTGNRTSYPEGPQGLIFNYNAYADALELRPNGEFAIFYHFYGRPDSDRVDGTWELTGDDLRLDFSAGQVSYTVQIVSLEGDTLYMQDGDDADGKVYTMSRQ